MDLRGNPGGLYDQAQKVADAFIDQGVLVSMVGSGLGVVLAVPTVSMFDRLIPDMPIRLAVTPTVVGIALLICLLAGLVSGIYPAWRIASVPPTRYLGKV